MSLPKISTPTYTITLPSNNTAIKIRPYTVKEEKLLLTAAETQNTEHIMESVKNIIQNCLNINKQEIDIEKLPNVDLEYVFLQLRIRSVGETTVLGLKGTDCSVEGCPANPVEVDLTTVTVEKPDNFNPTIVLDEASGVGVVMKLPTIEILNKMRETTSVSMMYELITYCIDYVFDNDTTYKDFTEKEITDFVSNLDTKKFMKIMEFFDSVPRLKKDVTFTCSKCGKEYTQTLEGFVDFFM